MDHDGFASSMLLDWSELVYSPGDDQHKLYEPSTRKHTRERSNELIYFIGAGPGDPELLTVKGKRLIDSADVVVYAGSLVNPEVLKDIRPDALVYNSASMTLEQVLQVMCEAYGKNKTVARVHTGDPSVYGAHREQMDQLKALGIPFEVVPGVSSFLAAAASLQKEYTLPQISQTVILTRLEGRTPVPEGECLRSLSSHQASLVLFLSVDRLREAVKQMQEGGYPADTPAAVVYKASWNDEIIVEGTLESIAERTEKAKIIKTALVLVGGFLGNEYERSRLYHPGFSHGFRTGLGQEGENG